MSRASVIPIATRKWPDELEELFEKQHRLVYRTAYSLTGSVQDAEDVLQTVFLRLLAREVPPDLSRDPEPYLYRAAFNLSMDVIRARQRSKPADDATIAEKAAHNPDDVEEIEQLLHAAIAQLSPVAAQIVVLRYIHSKNEAEIARIMGTTRSTVAVSLFRSRRRLRKLLEAMPGFGKVKS
jgi:RNA polymerase sigma-70 factor (ECF subfamily)